MAIVFDKVTGVSNFNWCSQDVIYPGTSRLGVCTKCGRFHVKGLRLVQPMDAETERQYAAERQS
jgi:hypothetical protein